MTFYPRGQGRGVTWLRAHVGYQSDDCLKWPFSTNRGYGNLGHEGKVHYAHRFMCELANGPEPDGCEAAHSCGNGHLGCVNPKHLSWKTRAENQADRHVHRRGPSNHWGRKGKLVWEQVVEIRAQSNMRTVTELATAYGVDRSTIRQIQTGKTWPRPHGLVT